MPTRWFGKYSQDPRHGWFCEPREALRKCGDDSLVVEVWDRADGDPSIERKVLDRVRAATPSEFVLVIAHNNENCLKFPDGSELDLEELYSNLATPRFRGLVLTCESVKYAKGETDALLTTTRLEYDEIACALKTALDRGAPGEKCRCVDTLLRAIQRELVSCSGALERVVKIGIASVGSGIVVASVYLIHSADDDDEEEQQENPDRVGEETNSETSGRKAKAGDR